MDAVWDDMLDGSRVRPGLRIGPREGVILGADLGRHACRLQLAEPGVCLSTVAAACYTVRRRRLYIAVR